MVQSQGFFEISDGFFLSAHGATDSTEKYRDSTATPNFLVEESKAPMEKVETGGKFLQLDSGSMEQLLRFLVLEFLLFASCQ